MTVDELRRACADLGIVPSVKGTVRQSDAARLLGGVSVRTLQRWRRDGLLAAPVLIGRSLRYRLVDLADAMSRFVARRDDEALHESLPHRQHRHRHAVPCSHSRRR